jgi:transcriptional regulator
MYLPKHFTNEDSAAITAFVAEVAAADFISVDGSGQPLSTLMPCTWVQDPTDDAPAGTLYMHMARANKQWESIVDGSRGLAIVHGPQAYVSPSNYASKLEDGKVVPTWNYTAVHLSGTVTVSHDTDYLLEIVSRLTDSHEGTREKPWKTSDAPDTYMNAQLRGIVAITLHVDRVEAKEKLSQNRSSADQQGVIADLAHSPKAEEREISEMMKRKLDV